MKKRATPKKVASQKAATRKQRLAAQKIPRKRLAKAKSNTARRNRMDAQHTQPFTHQDSAQPYRRLVEEMNDGAAILSADGTILYGNRRLAELLRTTRDDLSGLSFSRFVLESEHVIFEALLRQALKATSQGELSLQRADGAHMPVHLSFNALQLDGSVAVGLIVTDLTEQKRNEDIMAAERLARSILDQAAEAIIVVDENGRVIRASQMAQQLAGKNPLLQPFEFVFPLRLKAEPAPGVSAGKRTAQNVNHWFSPLPVLYDTGLRGVEATYTRGGQTLNLLLSAGPLLNAQNEIRGCVITLTDISERARAQEQLRFQANILQNVQESVIVSDIQGKVVYWNEGAAAIFGYSAQEMLGKSTSLLYPSQSEEELANNLLDILEGRDHVGEWKGQRNDGSTVWVEIKTSLLRDSDGRILGFLGVMRDVTARKAGERRLATQYAVTHILSKSGTIAEAIPQVLQAVCENLGWDVGAMWTMDREANALRSYNTWQAEDTHADEFIAATCDSTRALNEGLPGQVWANRKPVWIDDYHNQANHSRSALASKDGLRTALAFPISVGGEVSGIIECFNRESLPLDGDMLVMLNALGSQIGQFIERKRAENEVYTQREHLRVTLASIGDAVIATDVQGRVTFINQVAESLMGWTQAEAVGKLLQEIFQIVNEETRATVENPVSKALRAGRVSGLANHTLLIARNGREIPIADSGAPIRDDAGTVIGVVLVFRDITERRQAEEAMTRLAAIVESSYDAIIGKDLDGTIVSWNPGAERLYQYTAAEAIGKPISFIMPADRLDEFSTIMQRLRRGEAIEYYETTRVRKDGHLVDVSISISPLKDTMGRIIGAATIARDISERKRAREAQRFLAEASAILSSSLDYEQTLASVAQLVAPQLADWCTVHVLSEDETLQQLALAHVNPEKVEWAHELQRRFPPNPDAPRGVPNVLRTGQPEYMTEIPDELLVEAIKDPEQLRLTRELGLKSYMIVPMIASGRALGAISFVYAESGRRYAPADVAFAEALAGRAALAVENARLYRQSQQLNTELEQRVIVRTAELRAANANLRTEINERARAEATVHSLFRMSEKLNSTLDPDTLLDVLAQEALKLVDAECGCAGLREAGHVYTRKYFNGSEAVPWEYHWWPGQDLPGWVLQHKSPYLTNDPTHDPQVMSDLPINVGINSALCTPIFNAQGEVIGFFDIQNKKRGAKFTQADIDLLMAISQTAAIAIQNALAYQKIHQDENQLRFYNTQLRHLSAHLESAREEERTRIAREIHDELGQVLTALKMDLSMLGRKFAGTAEVQPAMVLQDLKAMGTLIDNTIQSVRELITELRPEMLEDLGLRAAMEWQVQEFQTRTGIECHFSADVAELDLDHERSIVLFRILQESLTNVARHAQATRVDIDLKKTDGGLVLRIQDNGRGISPGEMAQTKSFGILGMRERALLLGGEMELGGQPGQGTTLSVRVPVVGA